MMITIVTPRLILATTPLHVIDNRLEHDDFVAEVPISTDDDGERRREALRVHFPPEWPGDALVMLPSWKAKMEADPTYEVMGGIMIDRLESTAVGGMSFRDVPD